MASARMWNVCETAREARPEDYCGGAHIPGVFFPI